MALVGDLKTFNFVDILQVLSKDRKSGILLVEWNDLTVAYYVKDGELIFARPVDRVFRVYTERDFDALIERLRVPKESLHKTIERFFINKLNTKEGVFSFIPGFIRYSSSYPVVYPVEKLIMIASRVLTPEETERKISDDALVFEPAPESNGKLQRAELNEVEKKVYSLVDGERTVFDIRKDSGLDNLTVDRALYGFLALGAIRRKKKEKKQKTGITLELLMKVIERVKGL